jgi:hypothetical protein
MKGSVAHSRSQRWDKKQVIASVTGDVVPSEAAAELRRLADELEETGLGLRPS